MQKQVGKFKYLVELLTFAYSSSKRFVIANM